MLCMKALYAPLASSTAGTGAMEGRFCKAERLIPAGSSSRMLDLDAEVLLLASAGGLVADRVRSSATWPEKATRRSESRLVT